MADSDARVIVAKAFCNRCHQETNHNCRPVHMGHYTEGGGENKRPIQESWDLLVCLGCECVRIRCTKSSPGFSALERIEYPPAERMRVPTWQADLPEGLRAMHAEVHKTLQAGAFCCATMGVRTLIDMTLTAAVGDKGNFQATLAAAVQAAHLTQQQGTILATAYDAGSAAAHRGFTPNEQQLEDALGIVENLLQGHYILGPRSFRLQSQIPPRRI